MRVLAGPRLDLGGDPVVRLAARWLAGTDGDVQSLRDAGVRNLSRPLSTAEVALLREALRGDGDVVGYLCKGTARERARRAGATGDVGRVWVAVTDHINLTWRSPLKGPNDDSVGPRFPSMTGIYAPEVVGERLSPGEGMIVTAGVVAGVGDDVHLNAFETETVESGEVSAASSELVPVAIVAAHMGLRLAAAVLVAGSWSKEKQEGEG